jgi:hypothetical protein
MEDCKKTGLQKAALFARGAVVFVILLAVVAGLCWMGYHRYPNVADWAGETDDFMSGVYLRETDRFYVRITMSDESDEEGEDGEEIIKYTVEKVLGEVTPAFPMDWNTNYVVEKIKDEEDLVYITIDDEQVLYCAEDTDNPLLQKLLNK